MGATVCFVLVTLACCIAVSHSAVTCEYNGKHYPVGSFQPSPCEPCQCTSSGRAYCAIVDCFYTPCVDPVQEKDQCCPTCPNGHNCRAPDGHIIKQGEKYAPDSSTVCHCDSFSPLARCAVH